MFIIWAVFVISAMTTKGLTHKDVNSEEIKQKQKREVAFSDDQQDSSLAVIVPAGCIEQPAVL